MGLIIVLFKLTCFFLFCLVSGFTLTLGTHDSNIKQYYLFFAICVVGVLFVL